MWRTNQDGHKSHRLLPPESGCDRNLGQLHDSPDDVEDGRNDHSDEQQQEWVIQDALHHGNPRVLTSTACFVAHGFAYLDLVGIESAAGTLPVDCRLPVASMDWP